MRLRIALAAETILYLPFYVIRERDLVPGVTLELVPKGGDTNAYAGVTSGDFQACVCDPMVLATEAAFNPSRAPSAVAVASVVSKTGLWAIATPRLGWQVGPAGSATLLSSIDASAGKAVKNVVTYDGASTGGRVMAYLGASMTGQSPAVNLPDLRRKFAGARLLHEPFGEELKRILEDPAGTAGADVVVTCDIVGAIAAERDGDQLTVGGWRPRIVERFSDAPKFRDALFTVLIVSAKFMADHPKVVARLVSALQRVLSEFYGAAQGGDSVASQYARIMVNQPDAFPAVGAGKIFNVDNDRLLELCMLAIEELRSRQVLSTSVRIERRAWDQAFEIWDISHEAKQLPVLGRAIALGPDTHFKVCCDTRVARRASPAFPWVRFLGRRVLWKYREPLAIWWNSFLLVAVCFQLAQHPVTTFATWSTVMGVASVIAAVGAAVYHFFVGFDLSEKDGY